MGAKHMQRSKTEQPDGFTARSSCPTPTPTPAAPQTRYIAPAPETGSDSVYYANCTEARNAGAAPIQRGQPGYRSAMDRDGDGVACDAWQAIYKVYDK
jgi:hypothetical protein